MFRFLKVMGLWCLFSVAGLIAVALGTWTLAVVGVNSLITPFLVSGLASVLPVSLAVADNVVPRDHRLVLPSASCSQCGVSLSCPHCGISLNLGLSAKPDPGSWLFV
jgi:hypothetical protein